MKTDDNRKKIAQFPISKYLVSILYMLCYVILMSGREREKKATKSIHFFLVLLIQSFETT